MLTSIRRSNSARKSLDHVKDNKIVVLAEHPLAKEPGSRFKHLPPAVLADWYFPFFCGLGTFQVSLGGKSYLIHDDGNSKRGGRGATDVLHLLHDGGATLGEAFVDETRKIGTLTHTAWLWPAGNYDSLHQMSRHAENCRKRGTMPMPALSECPGGVWARWPLVPALTLGGAA